MSDEPKKNKKSSKNVDANNSEDTTKQSKKLKKGNGEDVDANNSDTTEHPEN